MGRTRLAILALAVVVIVAVVADAGVAYVAVASTPSCSSTMQPSSVYDVHFIEMMPSSEAAICVRFSFSGSGLYIVSEGVSMGPIWYSQESSVFSPCGSGLLPNASVRERCEGLRVAVSPTLPLHLDGSNTTVRIAITTSSFSSGVYWLVLGECLTVNLVVGPVPKSLQAPVSIGCPRPFIPGWNSPSGALIVGYSGLTVSTG